MRARRHASWLSDFDYGILVLAQPAVVHTYWFRGLGKNIVRRELFFSRRSAGDSALEPFTLNQMMVAFILLGAGMLLAGMAFVLEAGCSYFDFTVVKVSEITVCCSRHT